MMKYENHFAYFVLALLIFGFGAIIGAEFPGSRPTVAIIREWQTLISAIIALCAAFITILVLLRQIATSDRHMEDARRRKLFAARAVLPNDLSEIVRYSMECSRQILEAIVYYKQNSDPPAGLNSPILDKRIIGNLQELIEYLPEADALELADLLSCYQIQNARLNRNIDDWNGISEVGVTKVFTLGNIEATIEYTLKLYMLGVHIFDFARREVDNISPANLDAASVHSCLANLDPAGILSNAAKDRVIRVVTTS